MTVRFAAIAWDSDFARMYSERGVKHIIPHSDGAKAELEKAGYSPVMGEGVWERKNEKGSNSRRA